MIPTTRQPGKSVAVLLPGSGSGAGFVRRAFGPALACHGLQVVTCDLVPGRDVVASTLRALDDLAAGIRPRIVGGVSLGAHLAARWAAGGGPAARGLSGLLLALPAWTGAPDPVVAGASAAAADRIGRDGMAAALDGAARHAVPWVAEELAAAWPGYADDLAGTLRATAQSWGPTRAELARITAPTGLVAFADDPLHPVAVAEEWAATPPHAALERLTLADCATSRAPLGHAAVRAWQRAAQNT